MPRSLVASFAVAGVLLSFAAAPAADPAPRTWSDTTGRLKIKGTFVSLEGGVVTLRQENGKEIEIPLRKLNAADQALAKLAAESAAEKPSEKEGDENPLKPKTSDDEPATGQPSDDPADPPPLKTGPVAVAWSSARAVPPLPEKSNWSEAVEPAQVAEVAPPLKPKTIRLPSLRDVFEKPQAFVFSPNREKALVGYVHSPPGKPPATRLVLLDMKTGKALGSGQTDGEFAPLGLTDDGRRVLLRSAKFGFGENGSLEVWGLSQSGIERGPEWAPYQDGDHVPHRDIHWGSVLADGRGLSINAGGRLALWDLDEVSPLWFIDLPQAQIPAVGPDGKYLACEVENAIALLDMAAGKVLARLPAEKMGLTSLAFSPDGRFLAGVGGDTLWIWDVAAGSLHREVNIDRLTSMRPVAWADPEYVLVDGLNGPALVHADSRIPAWQYTDASLATAAGGITWFYLSVFGGGEAIVGADLPHAAAEAALKQAMADPNFFLLKPGSTVALDASGIPAADRAAVTAALRKRITEAGFKIAASAPVVVKASMSRGQSREIRYRSFGSFNEETHSVQEYVLAVAFVSNGAAVWESKGVHFPAPFFASLKQDQTIAELLRESDKPSYEFYNSVRLPKFIPRPSDQAVLGTSAVTLQGIR